MPSLIQPGTEFAPNVRGLPISGAGCNPVDSAEEGSLTYAASGISFSKAEWFKLAIDDMAVIGTSSDIVLRITPARLCDLPRACGVVNETYEWL